MAKRASANEEVGRAFDLKFDNLVTVLVFIYNFRYNLVFISEKSAKTGLHCLSIL